MKGYFLVLRIIALGLLWTLYACGPDSAQKGHKGVRAVPTWSVYNKMGEEVLRVKDTPGPLISAAIPPPDSPPVLNPFLSATALEPTEEDALHAILEKSRSFNEFIQNLKKSGYSVVQR